MPHTDFSSAAQNLSEIEITVTGRTSGRPISLPIWFALDGNKLYLIPVKGSDTEWYKNMRKTPTIHLSARGETLTTSIHILTDEVQLDKVLDKFRDKYGRNVKSYYPKYDVAVEVLVNALRSGIYQKPPRQVHDCMELAKRVCRSGKSLKSSVAN